MKLKSRSGAKKRLKLTATGRVKHKKMNLRHILTKKRPNRKRRLRALEVASAADEKKLKRMIAG